MAWEWSDGTTVLAHPGFAWVTRQSTDPFWN